MRVAPSEVYGGTPLTGPEIIKISQAQGYEVSDFRPVKPGDHYILEFRGNRVRVIQHRNGTDCTKPPFCDNAGNWRIIVTPIPGRIQVPQ